MCQKNKVLKWHAEKALHVFYPFCLRIYTCCNSIFLFICFRA